MGGKSTGAKTKEGIENIRKANFKHGLYTQKHMNLRKNISFLIKNKIILY